MASAGEAIVIRRPSRLIVPRVDRRDAEKTLHRLGAAGAHEAVEPQNFALAQVEGNIGDIRSRSTGS